MNAFHKFNPPESDNSVAWSEAVEAHLQLQPCVVDEVLEIVREAVKTQKVRFRRGDVPDVLKFVNSVLASSQRVKPTVTAWDLDDLVPPCSKLFVVPDEVEFKFKPMFTL